MKNLGIKDKCLHKHIQKSLKNKQTYERCFNPYITCSQVLLQFSSGEQKRNQLPIECSTHSKYMHHHPQQISLQAWLQAMWPTLVTPTTRNTGTKANKINQTGKHSLYSRLKAELHTQQLLCLVFSHLKF